MPENKYRPSTRAIEYGFAANCLSPFLVFSLTKSELLSYSCLNFTTASAGSPYNSGNWLEPMAQNTEKQTIEDLLAELPVKGRKEDRYVLPVIEKITRILRESAGTVASSELHRILRFADSVGYYVTIHEAGAGCWTGTTFTRTSDEEADLTELKQAARQELLRRGEPEEEAECGKDAFIVPDEENGWNARCREAALRYWRGRTILKRGKGKAELIRKAAENTNRSLAVNLLAGALGDADPDIRMEAVVAAGRMKPPPLPVLEQASWDEDDRVLSRTVKVLARMQTGQAAIVIGRIAVKAKDLRVRKESIDALSGIRAPESAGILIWLYRRTKSPAVRKYLIKALGRTGGPKVIRFLAETLADEGEEIRSQARAALEPYGKPVFFDALAASLDLATGLAVKETLLLLAKENDSSALDLIIPFLRHEDTEYRLYGVEALEACRSPKTSLLLAQMLKDSDSDVRERAVRALGETRAPNRLSALEDALRHDDAGIARRAAMVLSGIADAGIPSILKKALSHEDEEIRWIAVEGLIRRDEYFDAGVLTRLLETSDNALREKTFRLCMETKQIQGAKALAAFLPKATGDTLFRLLDFFARTSCSDAVDSLVALYEKDRGEIRKKAALALKHQKWHPENLELAREFWLLVGDMDAMVKAGLPEAVPAMRQKALNTDSHFEMLDCCKQLAKIKNPEAISALIAVMNTQNYMFAIHAANELIRLNNAQANQGLVDHVFGSRRLSSVENAVIGKGMGGEIALIVDKTRNALQAESAVKFLERILRKRPDTVSGTDLARLASLAPRAVVTATTVEACQVFVRTTTETRRMECTSLRQLAKQELARRNANG